MASLAFLPALLVAIIYASCSNLIKANPNDLSHVCSYKQYSIYLKNGIFHNCTNCPSCRIGTGLDKECGAALYEGTQFGCHVCVNGSTFNSMEAVAVPCTPCDIQAHRTMVEPCNSTTDTRYADSCEEGYYFKETSTGACKACSCCTGGVNATCTELVDSQEIICKCPDMKPTSDDNATLPPTHYTLESNSSFTTGNFTTLMTADVKFSKPGGAYWKIIMGIMIPVIVVVGGISTIGFIVHHRHQHLSDSQDIPLIQAEIPLSKMSLNLREHLRRSLDTEKPHKNWYHVGEAFKVSKKDLELMRLEYKREGGSPTVTLLETLSIKGTGHPYTIGGLFTKLKRLGRSDIIRGWDWSASCEE